jgi:hypothetical protein
MVGYDLTTENAVIRSSDGDCERVAIASVGIWLVVDYIKGLGDDPLSEELMDTHEMGSDLRKLIRHAWGPEAYQAPSGGAGAGSPGMYQAAIEGIMQTFTSTCMVAAIQHFITAPSLSSCVCVFDGGC